MFIVLKRVSGLSSVRNLTGIFRLDDPLPIREALVLSIMIVMFPPVHTHAQVIKHPSVSGSMTVVYLPSMEEVTGFKLVGVMEQGGVSKVC